MHFISKKNNKKYNFCLNFNILNKKFFLHKIKINLSNISKKQFLNYLNQFSKGPEKSKWEQNIVRTALPCIAVPSKRVNDIVKQLAKQNFIDFINLWIWENHTCTLIIGNLITKIKDFEKQKQYLEKYAQKADNWATIDCLKFNFNNENKSKFFEFAKQLLTDKHTFSRRLGVVILLKLCKDFNYIDKIIAEIPSLYLEEEYYVNMAVAWLVCEIFIQNKQKALWLFQNNKLNKFVNNKSISKCKDSFRVSKADKIFLNNYLKI